MRNLDDIVLSEISRFDIHKYAWDVFFNSEWERRSKIYDQYYVLWGGGAYNYMTNTFYAWKNGRVSPNYSSRYNIISSTAASFDNEEKFLYAFAIISKFIKKQFPKCIKYRDLNKTYGVIISLIESFKFLESESYTKYVFNEDERQEYESYFKLLFKFYTKEIFSKLYDDIQLISKLYDVTNTSFLSTTFKTYLYEIELNVRDFIKVQHQRVNRFQLAPDVTYEEIQNHSLSSFSHDKILLLINTKIESSIDYSLNESEIQDINAEKIELRESKKGGNISLNLKSTCGILSIKLKVPSKNEQRVILSKTLAFFLIIGGLAYYCLVMTNYTGWLIFGIIISFLIFVVPTIDDLIGLVQDLLRKKVR